MFLLCSVVYWPCLLAFFGVVSFVTDVSTFIQGFVISAFPYSHSLFDDMHEPEGLVCGKILFAHRQRVDFKLSSGVEHGQWNDEPSKGRESDISNINEA